MRTTIVVEDQLFKAYKEQAARRGRTFSAEVEEALRAELTRREAAASEPYEFKLITGEGGAVEGVDIDSNAALDDLGL